MRPWWRKHKWGPHKDGIRWVQCQRCGCLLHEDPAKGSCNKPALMAYRGQRRIEFARAMRVVAHRESGRRSR